MIKTFSTVQYLKIDSTLYTVISCQSLLSGDICNVHTVYCCQLSIVDICNVHTDLLVFLILTSEEVLDCLTSVTDNVVVMTTGSLEFQCSRGQLRVNSRQWYGQRSLGCSWPCSPASHMACYCMATCCLCWETQSPSSPWSSSLFSMAARV